MPDSPVPHIVQNCSSSSIQQGLRQIRSKHLPNSRWLAKGNRYRLDTTKKVDQDYKNSTLKPGEISQYIAASVLLHCQDGWNYLSKAIEGLVDGDLPSSFHMAYYAELRAVMSFFAAEGVGVFNYRHVWFDGNQNEGFSVSSGTHKFIKDALDEWAATPQRARRLLEIIAIRSIPLSDWVQSAAAGQGQVTFSLLAEQWLRSWSVDLAILKKDQTIRNLASYRPQALNGVPKSDLREALKTVVSFWEACEPNQNGRFGLLDMYLLRHTLEQTYSGINGQGVPLADFRDYVRDTAVALGLSSTDQLVRFLGKQLLAKNHNLFLHANKAGLLFKKVFRPLPVIARAILLLRLSTAAATDLLLNEGIDRSDLNFWWASSGQNAGLWLSGDEPLRMSDLWIQIEESAKSIKDLLSSTTGNLQFRDTRLNNSNDLWQLTRFQAAGWWGIWE